MSEEKNIDPDNIINLNSKKEIDKFIIDINETETTKGNESLNQINDNNHIININEKNNKTSKEIDNIINENLNQTNNYYFEKNKNIIKEFNFIDEDKKINKNKKKKSSLKGSKNKINYIKKEIINILEEEKIIERLNLYKYNYNQINNMDNIFKCQEKYEKELDKIFNNKIEKIKEINKKYDPELNELFYYIEEEEKKEKSNESIDSSSATKILYDALLEDKKKDLDDLYTNSKEAIKNIGIEFFDNIDSNTKEGFFEELFKDIKSDILKIIKPEIQRKVSFC